MPRLLNSPCAARSCPKRLRIAMLAAVISLLALRPAYRLMAADDPEPAVPADVLAALTAAARGEPFSDDLHPDTARTGRPPSAIQRRFDVRHYQLDLRIVPDLRQIEGTVAVRVRALADIDRIELDLDQRLQVEQATVADARATLERSISSVVIRLPEPLVAGEVATVRVRYRGHPHIALAPPWHGGFVWSEVDGVPWFATAVQTEGCDLWWPCKDTYADKPEEGVAVSVTAPRGVTIASVGILEGVDRGRDGFDTWHWVSRHPYTGYAVAINGGPYQRVERIYSGINGSEYPVQFWALPQNAEKAEALMDTDVLPHLAFFERLLGPYPWGDEKVGFVETPHLGMEHQTINAYGEQYARGAHGFDQLLHHELAHEWFGNLMTHERPQDAWLHEGYAAWMQAVYAEETIGDIGYYDRMYEAYTRNAHCTPVVDDTVADVGEAFDNRDIYTKGAWLLHTLRRHIGDEAFWAGTRRLLYDTRDPWSLSYPLQPRYRTTEDFIRIMSEEAGRDIAWLVKAYLYEADMPRLFVEREPDAVALRGQLPGGRNFPMPITLSIDGVEQQFSMADGATRVPVPAGARLIIDPHSDLLRALPIIGDCDEQTGLRIDYNIERFTRMARDYGWRRD